jgi:hypothetical protein
MGKLRHSISYKYPKAKKMPPSWGYEEKKGAFKSIAVLELPPVDSTSAAVNATSTPKARNRDYIKFQCLRNFLGCWG